MTIKWEDPPVKYPNLNPAYKELREACLANPGKWALMTSGNPGTYSAIAKNVNKPKSSWFNFEVTTRLLPGGKRKVYVRYKGDLPETS